jgi:predicted nucleic acid-binding protein
VKTWLIDTGPIVAFLDARDPAHEEVAQRWAGQIGVCATTSAVITEAMHLLAADPGGPAALAELVSLGNFRVFDLCRPPDLVVATQLMAKYADTPMDFADATLVLLAEALGARDILTLDRRGFTTYRSRQRAAFRLLLDT